MTEPEPEISDHELPGSWVETAIPFLKRLAAHSGDDNLGDRHPLTRTGTREPLPDSRRLLVLKRDRFTCQFCYQWGGSLEVDHILPWSAGGSDEPTNLRTLCEDCNQRRSNRHTVGDETPALPATWLCDSCAGPEIAVTGEAPEAKSYYPAYCGRCDQVSHVATERQDRE